MHDAVGGDGFGAGVEDVLFDLGNGQGETIERGIQLRQIAIDLGEKRDFSLGDAAEQLRAPGKGRLGLSGFLLAGISRRGQEHSAIHRQRLQIVKLRHSFRGGNEIRLEMTEHNFLQHVFEEIDLPVAFDESVNCGPELLELGG